MNKKTMKITIFTAVFLSVSLHVTIQKAKKLTPQEKAFVFFANNAIEVIGTRTTINHAGGEKAFLKATMFPSTIFHKPFEYTTFPLIQKKGHFLGPNNKPKNQNEVVAQADFSIKTGRQKIFYKLQDSGTAQKSKIVCLTLQQRSRRGAIKNENKLLGPKNFGYQETFAYSFPYTVRTKKYGSIVYKCFATKSNNKLNTIFKNYTKYRKRR